MDKGKGYPVKVISIEEFKLDSNCTHDSYYQCLSTRFSHLGKADMDSLGPFSEKSKFKTKCTPYSLPSNNKNIPFCVNNVEANCYKEVLKNMKKDQHRLCKKSCHVKEYKLGNEAQFGHNSLNPNSFAFALTFELPSSTKNLRSDDPFKTIHRETFSLSGMTLVGNIGGHLGMFIGFSFIAYSVWLLEFISKFCTTLSKDTGFKKENNGKDVILG